MILFIHLLVSNLLKHMMVRINCKSNQSYRWNTNIEENALILTKRLCQNNNIKGARTYTSRKETHSRWPNARFQVVEIGRDISLNRCYKVRGTDKRYMKHEILLLEDCKSWNIVGWRLAIMTGALGVEFPTHPNTFLEGRQFDLHKLHELQMWFAWISKSILRDEPQKFTCNKIFLFNLPCIYVKNKLKNIIRI